MRKFTAIIASIGCLLLQAMPGHTFPANKLYCDDETTPSYQTDGCAVTGATGVVTIPLRSSTASLKNGTMDIRGTWAGASCAVQASIDGTNFEAVEDSLGVAIALTADGAVQFLTLGNGPWGKARINCTGGAGGTSLTVTFQGDYQ